ncbi:MAG: HEAT repeat domain-containing protein [Ardenticatenales bacterium]|nr:HEAT repeat domain-containing protein [Ardenticatenales bacterium]
MSAGVTRRLGPSGGLRWQVATHWGIYGSYLDALEARLSTGRLPGGASVRIEDAYIPLRLRPWSMSPEGRWSVTSGTPLMSLDEALEAHRHVLLIGPAGTGKSTLVRWQAVASARSAKHIGRRALLTDGGPPPLPVYIDGPDLPPEGDLEAVCGRIVETLAGEGGQALFLQHLAVGRATLLFDGLDTVPPDARRRVAERVRELVRRHPSVRVVVAMRDAADAAHLAEFAVLEVAGVDPGEVETLVARWGQRSGADQNAFLQVIERNVLVRSLVARPGWLAAGLSRSVGPRLRAFDVVANFVAFIDPEGIEPFPAMALAMHEAGGDVGRAEDVAPERRSSGLLWWLSDDRFTFVHASAQAYFAAAAIAADFEAHRARLLDRASDPWWQPVVVFTAGHLDGPNAARLADDLRRAGHVELAGLALAEAIDAPEPLVEAVAAALLERLMTVAPADRQRLAVALAGLVGTEPVRRTGVSGPVLQTLAHGPALARQAAARALGALEDPAAIAPLLTSLGDPEPGVRAAASDALAAFGERALQPLVRQLSYPSEHVRDAAARGLARMGIGAVPALVRLLDSTSPTSRNEAAETLAAIGAPAVPALVALVAGEGAMGDRTAARLDSAAASLKRIGAPAVREVVTAYADADPPTQARLVNILRAMGDGVFEAFGAIIADARQPNGSEAAALLGLVGQKHGGAMAAKHLVAALGDSRFEVQDEARRSLSHLKDDARAALVAALTHKDVRVRWEAAQILLKLPAPPIPELLGVFEVRLAGSDVGERRQAVEALGKLMDPAAAAVLRQAIQDADPIVRRSAMQALAAADPTGAAEPLVARWAAEEDVPTALTLLDVLSTVDAGTAIPVLIDALAASDKRLRVASTELLASIGEAAVVPLVSALNARPGEIDLEGSLRVLERAGTAARSGGHTPANLARTYHRMLVEPLDVDELVYLATTIEWWPPALELHRTFLTAKKFMAVQSLGGIGNAEQDLDWIDAEEWLRPAAQRAMRQLRLISQSVQYYNRSGKRSAKEKGLLNAIAQLNDLQTLAGDLGVPHDRVLLGVVDHWRTLTNAAIREFQGRAELALEARTENVRIRDIDTTAVLVFEIINAGEGLASNIQMTLSAPDGEVALQSSPTHYLPPLGQGDRLSVEYTVRRHGAGIVPLSVDVRYDDPQGEGQLQSFTQQVRFFVEEQEYREIGPSPYIAGPPVKSREMFYGRGSIFTWVRENLSGTYQANVLVLYGERRTGKTSVLYQLQHHLPEYGFVLIDLQSIAYALGSTTDVLYAMARKAATGLSRQGFVLERPEREQYVDNPLEQFVDVGEEIGRQAIASGRRAVIICDEFDLLIEAVENGQVSPYVFDTIRGLMQHQEGLSFIFTGAYKVSEMLRNPTSILFNTALRRKVSFLERDEAERLIREPVQDVLWYDDLAVEKILRVTAGQPYFIQYICHEIVNLCRHDRKNFATLRDVDRALQTTVQETTGIIRNGYQSLTREERILLAAVSRVTDDGRPYVGLDDILDTLRQDNVDVPKRDGIEVMRQLVDRDFITERAGEGYGRQYGFTMELVRIWLEQNDEYNRLLEELRHE